MTEGMMALRTLVEKGARDRSSASSVMPPSFTRKRKRPPKEATGEHSDFRITSDRHSDLPIRLQPIDLLLRCSQRLVLLGDRCVARDQLLLDLPFLDRKRSLAAEGEEQRGTRVRIPDRRQHRRELQLDNLRLRSRRPPRIAQAIIAAAWCYPP